MIPRGKITEHMLLASDFSTPARAAAEVAGKLAQRVQPRVTLLHALSPLPLGGATPFVPMGTSPDEVIAQMDEKAREGLSEVRREHFEGVPALTVRTSIHRNAPAAICDAADAAHADLVVIGTHGLTGVARLLYGSVAEKVVRHANCSVLVVHPEAASPTIPPRHVVCGIDFSAGSLEALEQAKSWWTSFQCTVTLLHVVQSRSLLERPFEHAAPEAFAAFQAEQEAQSKDRLAALRLERFGDDPRVRLVVVAAASPADVISTYAEENRADLVVLGTLGLTGLSRMLIGSVAERVTRHCPVSVLVVRPQP